MPDQPWPPPTYFDHFSNFTPLPDKLTLLFPLDDEVLEVDGSRFLRYQLPEVPVEIGTVEVAGYLRSTTGGELLDAKNQVVGTIDHDTGLMQIDVDLSPLLSARRAKYVFPRP